MVIARAERRCSNAESCPLFVQFTLEPSLRVWRGLYCLGNYESCARYRREVRGCAVPPHLYPNGSDGGVAQLPSQRLARAGR
jgi:hypothetical protein